MDECWFCKAQATLKKVMADIEALGEVNSGFYDDPLSDVYNAADDALAVMVHPHWVDGEEVIIR